MNWSYYILQMIYVIKLIEIILNNKLVEINIFNYGLIIAYSR